MSETTKPESIKYTLADVGCYVDGAHGIYATDSIVDFARARGFKTDETACKCDGCSDPQTVFESEFGSCEFAVEVEDEATNYMNQAFAVEGASWGRSESGDWGLWPDEDGESCAL